MFGFPQKPIPRRVRDEFVTIPASKILVPSFPLDERYEVLMWQGTPANRVALSHDNVGVVRGQPPDGSNRYVPTNSSHPALFDGDQSTNVAAGGATSYSYTTIDLGQSVYVSRIALSLDGTYGDMRATMLVSHDNLFYTSVMPDTFFGTATITLSTYLSFNPLLRYIRIGTRRTGGSLGRTAYLRELYVYTWRVGVVSSFFLRSVLTPPILIEYTPIGM